METKAGLQFDFSYYSGKEKRLAEKYKTGKVEVTLPDGYVFKLDPTEADKRIATEIYTRCRSRRVINSTECCETCVKNALESLQEVRDIFVDVKVKIGDVDSLLYFLLDYAELGILQFLTFTEKYDKKKDVWKYRAALDELRVHLIGVLNNINHVGGIKEGYDSRFSIASEPQTQDDNKPEIIHIRELLHDPGDLPHIDKWLLDNSIIAKDGKDTYRPYIWVAEDDNEELKIGTDTSKHLDKESLKKRPYSLRYHVAALGLFLDKECECLKGKYNASKVGRAVINYYTKEDPHDKSFLKAFENNSTALKKTEPYFKYFTKLKQAILVRDK